MTAILVDTWAFIALANRRDAGHLAAARVSKSLATQGTRHLTSDYVLDESLTALRRAIGVAPTVRWLAHVQSAVDQEIMQVQRVEPSLFSEAVRLFAKLDGKFPRLSFTDCTSFAIMRAHGIDRAFTADDHFVRAGGFIKLIPQGGGWPVAVPRRRLRATAWARPWPASRCRPSSVERGGTIAAP